MLHDLTSQRRYTLRIDLEDFMNASRFAIYQNFAVSSESDNFRVSFGAYSGTAGNTYARTHAHVHYPHPHTYTPALTKFMQVRATQIHKNTVTNEVLLRLRQIVLLGVAKGNA